MTPTRRKMIEDFQIRHYAAGTGKRPAGTGLAAPLNHHDVAGQLI